MRAKFINDAGEGAGSNGRADRLGRGGGVGAAERGVAEPGLAELVPGAGGGHRGQQGTVTDRLRREDAEQVEIGGLLVGERAASCRAPSIAMKTSNPSAPRIRHNAPSISVSSAY